MADMDLYIKLSSLSDNLIKEVDDFVDFLKKKEKNKEDKTRKKAGLAKGLIQMKQDFDDPVEDFKDYMK